MPPPVSPAPQDPSRSAERRVARVVRAALFGPPSAEVLLGAVAVCVAWWLLAAVLVRPGVLASLDERWLVAAADDDHAHLTREVLALRGASSPRFTVLVVGPSSTREAIVSAEMLRARIEDRSRRPVDVALLAANGLGPFEYAAILEAIPSGFRGVVSLAVSPSLLARCHPKMLELADAREDRILGWISRARDAELRRAGVPVPIRTGLYLWDAKDFLLPRALVPLAVLVGRGADYDPHRRSIPLAYLESDTASTRRRIAFYAKGAEIALPVLERAMTAFAHRAEEVRFVLVEQTEHPEAYPRVVGPERLAQYRGMIERFARRSASDTRVVDLGEAVHGEEFSDLVHLATPPARHRYTTALGIWLGDLVAGRRADAESAVREAWRLGGLPGRSPSLTGRREAP